MRHEITGTEDTPYQQIWTKKGMNACVLFIMDHVFTNLAFLDIEGEDAQEAAQELTQFISVFTPAELFALFDEAATAAERSQVLVLLGVAAPAEFDPAFYERFVAALEDADEEVRLAAVEAITLVYWPEIEALAQQVAETDPSKKVRAGVRILLEAIEKGL